MTQILTRLLEQHPKGRRAALDAWLAYHGVSKKMLAEQLDVHPSMITRIIQGKRAPKKRITQLISLGIPAELLPEPSGPPGRPKGSRSKSES
jgi:hypothetical protein